VSDAPETKLEIARRHVREDEKRVMRMALLINVMDKEKHPKARGPFCVLNSRQSCVRAGGFCDVALGGMPRENMRAS
jgi:hypothetical protein